MLNGSIVTAQVTHLSALENPNLQSGQVQIFFDERQENPEGKLCQHNAAVLSAIENQHKPSANLSPRRSFGEFR